MTNDKVIYHLIPKKDWRDVESKYRPDSLERDGFIHFCEEDQIGTVLEFEEESRENLAVLVVNKTEVEEDLKYENDFPHLYRELRKQEVREVKSASDFTQ